MQDRGTARENLDVNEDLDPTEAVLYTNPHSRIRFASFLTRIPLGALRRDDHSLRGAAVAGPVACGRFSRVNYGNYGLRLFDCKSDYSSI